MKEKEIIAYLRENIEPIEDNIYGNSYRASVYLIDGLYLPCVVFHNTDKTVELAIRRFKEEQSGKGFIKSNGYEEIVKSFVTRGNCVNLFDVASIEKSRFALPISVLKQIRSETSMSWTGFALKMKDGKYFGFGTTFSFEFFHLPETYSIDDIDEVINHSYVLKSGELCSHKIAYPDHPDNYKDAVIYRERPFFVCYIDNL